MVLTVIDVFLSCIPKSRKFSFANVAWLPVSSIKYVLTIQLENYALQLQAPNTHF